MNSINIGANQKILVTSQKLYKEAIEAMPKVTEAFIKVVNKVYDEKDCRIKWRKTDLEKLIKEDPILAPRSAFLLPSRSALRAIDIRATKIEEAKLIIKNFKNTSKIENSILHSTPEWLENVSKMFLTAAAVSAALTVVLGFTVSPLALIGVPIVVAFLSISYMYKVFAKDAAEDQPIADKIQIYRLILDQRGPIEDYLQKTPDSVMTNEEKEHVHEMLMDIGLFLDLFDESVKKENTL